MGTDLGRKFPPDWEGIPPHVSQNDLRLWEVYRRRFSSEYVAFYFDVAFGDGAAVPPGVPDNVAAAWRRNTRLRADVVGDAGAEWRLIELRPNAGPGALGAVQSYSTLWRADPPDQRPLRVIIVTDAMMPDVKVAARLAGVEVLELDVQ